MSLPPIHRLATSIWTRHGIPLHIKLNYLTFKHMLQPSLTPYPISARLKAVEHMLSSPIVYKNQFCELRELAAGRNSMDNRQYFTVAPKTHQLQYIEIPNTDIPCAPATRLVNCTDTTVNKQTPDTILYMYVHTNNIQYGYCRCNTLCVLITYTGTVEHMWVVVCLAMLRLPVILAKMPRVTCTSSTITVHQSMRWN